jgi:ATP-dependent Lhr-like helicase
LNRPWALALGAALEARLAYVPEIHADNNAIAIQLKSPMDPEEIISLVRPDNFRNLLRHSLEQSGFFGARFRECAGRALLLTRARFNQRLPLWMSRLQAKKLMTTVRQYADFPILLETWRTCLDDEFDLDRLEDMLGELTDGVVAWSFVSTATPSPFAANITFDQINRYMYADDSPDAAGSSSLSDRLIADVLANEQLRPRLSPATVERFEEKRQRRQADYQPQALEDWREWVKERLLVPEPEHQGPTEGLVWISDGRRRWLTHPELLQALTGSGLVKVEWVADAIPAVPDPRDAVQLASEILSFYGPRTLPQVTELLPRLPEGLFAEDSWITGLLIEGSTERYYCDAENYEILLRFQRAALRPEVVARAASQLPVMLARWQGFHEAPTEDNLVESLIALRGYGAPLKVWLDDLLAARFGPLPPAAMESALQSAELNWFGTGRASMTVAYPEDLPLFRPEGGPEQPPEPIRDGFSDPNAKYAFAQLADAQATPLDRFAETFWDAVWQGWLSADTLRPLRQGIERGFELKPVAPDRTSMRRARRGALRGEPRGFAGSWQLNSIAVTEADPLTALEEDKERARLLLDRYGVLTREIANREGGRLRWAKLFRALAMMELAGEIVSGYFFEGLTGPQFATPAALQAFNRLGDVAPMTFWLNACDPASPCGLGLGDGKLPQRRPQNYLSYLDDELALVVENGGSRLRFLLPQDHPRLTEVLGPLEHLVARERRVVVQTINDADARSSPYLTPISTILKGVKDHKQITLESR